MGIRSILSFLILIILFLLCSPVLAKPVKVILYPDRAKIFEEKTLAPSWNGNQTNIEIFIPITALRESFTFAILNKIRPKVRSVKFEISNGINNARLVNLKKKIARLENKEKWIKNRLNSVKDFLKAWQKVLSNPKITFDLNLNSKRLKALERLYTEKTNLINELKLTKKELKRLYQRLNNMIQGKEQQWKVIISLFSKKHTKLLKFKYSYFISNGVFWRPIYLIKSYPKKEIVGIEWKNELIQKTGIDWEGVDVYLATQRPSFRLNPFPIAPWIISPQVFTKSRSYGIKKTKAIPKAMLFEDIQQETSKKKEEYLFDIYYLGRIWLQAGETQLFTLKSFKLKGNFGYLVRPLDGNKAYLFADITSPYNFRFPKGEALFWINSGFVGKKRNFHISGNKFKFFLGVDPEVQVKCNIVEQGSGQKGLITKENTYKWLWRISIQNKKSIPINVNVELPFPQVKDERIKLEVLGDKNLFKIKDHLLKAKFNISKKETKSFLYGIKITYPKDMDVWWNRF